MERAAVVRVPLTAARPLARLGLLAVLACLGTMLTGSFAAFYYTEAGPSLRGYGLIFERLRPLHEALATAWMFLGGACIVLHYLFTTYGPPSPAAQRRLSLQLILWAVAGVGITVSLLAGVVSGREYLGYHPAFSALVLAGWLLFAWSWFEREGFSLRGKPAYVYMWSVAIPLFVVTYVEGHLYLFGAVSERPLRDIAIQWKSNGVLVGSFNQILYGALTYVSGRMRGDDGYAHSRTAFALLAVGLLNTFTNYGHHTYHLPQTPWIHWTAFLVSMLEIVILAKLGWDLIGLHGAAPASGDLRVPTFFARATTLWTTLMLALSMVISVPPLNTLIHGTHVVVAHSMGSMIGIDSMILWCVLGWLLICLPGTDPARLLGPGVRRAGLALNVALVAFWAAFLARGLCFGWQRAVGPAAPDLSLVFAWFPTAMLTAGLVLLGSALRFLVPWAGALARAGFATAEAPEAA